MSAPPPKLEQARFVLQYANTYADVETKARWHGRRPEDLLGLPDLVLLAAYEEAKKKDAQRRLGRGRLQP